jgi:hypothetical protein
VLDKIVSNIQWLDPRDGQRQFCGILEPMSAQLLAGADHDADRHIQLFGRGGAQQVAAAVLGWFQDE